MLALPWACRLKTGRSLGSMQRYPGPQESCLVRPYCSVYWFRMTLQTYLRIIWLGTLRREQPCVGDIAYLNVGYNVRLDFAFSRSPAVHVHMYWSEVFLPAIYRALGGDQSFRYTRSGLHPKGNINTISQQIWPHACVKGLQWGKAFQYQRGVWQGLP